MLSLVRCVLRFAHGRWVPVATVPVAALALALLPAFSPAQDAAATTTPSATSSTTGAVVGAAAAGDAPSSSTAPPVPVAAAPWQPLDPELLAKLQARDWSGAVVAAQAQLTRDPHNGEVLYQLACAQARLGKPVRAVATLDRACDAGFGDCDRADIDDDLESLHGRSDYAAVVARMRRVPIGSGLPVEPAPALPGLQTISRQEPDTLQFRLHLSPDATPARPHRLILWLHPSGGSCDSLVERYAPDLARCGYCLAVFPRKQYVGWSSREREALWPTAQAIGRIPGVDARHPMLWCFSAGGQTALTHWTEHPGTWGGLLLDAAYPIIVTDAAHHRGTLLRPSPAALATHTPILAVIGGNDGNLPTWRMAMKEWPKQEITLHEVPGHGHEFLYSGEEWSFTLAWLMRHRASEPVAPLVPVRGTPPTTAAALSRP